MINPLKWRYFAKSHAVSLRMALGIRIFEYSNLEAPATLELAHQDIDELQLLCMLLTTKQLSYLKFLLTTPSSNNSPHSRLGVASHKASVCAGPSIQLVPMKLMMISDSDSDSVSLPRIESVRVVDQCACSGPHDANPKGDPGSERSKPASTLGVGFSRALVEGLGFVGPSISEAFNKVDWLLDIIGRPVGLSFALTDSKSRKRLNWPPMPDETLELLACISTVGQHLSQNFLASSSHQAFRPVTQKPVT